MAEIDIEKLFTAWADREFGPAPDPAIPQTERYASYWKCWQDAHRPPGMAMSGGTRTLRALEELAAWHSTQALGWKRAAAFDAAEHAEPTRGSLERLSGWHNSQAKLLKACTIGPQEVGEIKLCPPGLIIGARTPLAVWKDGRMPPVGTKLYTDAEPDRCLTVTTTPAGNPVSDVSAKYLTVVYQVKPGPDAQAILGARPWVASGWCHAMHERDEAIEAARGGT